MEHILGFMFVVIYVARSSIFNNFSDVTYVHTCVIARNLSAAWDA